MHFVVSFFVRTDSTTVLGCTPPGPIPGTCRVSACLLRASRTFYTPQARMEQMFGTVHEPHADSNKGTPLVSSMALSREDSESAFSSARQISGTDVGQAETAMEVERDRVTLIQQSVRQLNTQFGRRGPRSRPMTIHRVKVTFKDEPGEGSGVARRFYTAVGEASLSEKSYHLWMLVEVIFFYHTDLESNRIGDEMPIYSQLGSYVPNTSGHVVTSSMEVFSLNIQYIVMSFTIITGIVQRIRRATSYRYKRDRERDVRRQLSADARAFHFSGSSSSADRDDTDGDLLPYHRQSLGERLLSTSPCLAASSEDTLRQRVEEAVELLLVSGKKPNKDGDEDTLNTVVGP
ncbi:E3 ubiquitin-protein ligase ubr5 [Desmophyllum pertusum]|uniref:E3 ubiquitin-protein ligase ubr5 n=1 Tax=Desmophyllum pertusum TaxID=174260 RepID=A0A9X0CWU5_9CNID|nr:E3 ubiquitin-protein ligase ubr5 [Desmophyllum pertusum]